MQERIAAIDLSEITTIAGLEGEKLVRAVRRQSRPRRWPWQPKTLYDLAHERSADAVELAAERSAALAAAVAHERDRLQKLVRQQSRPRRWFWQAKTARDQVDEQSARFVSTAAALSAELAEQAAQRRDALLAQLRQQSRPRRWFWQAKTARDRIDDHGAALRWASDDATSKAIGSLGAAREALQNVVAEAPQAFGATAGAAVDTLQGAADAARQRVSDTTGALSDALGATAGAAADTLQGAADNARQRVSATTGVVSEAINNRVEATTGAIGQTVAAGQRGVRRGVRLVRWSFWSFVGGVVAGVLVAPRSGDETRRELLAAAQHLGDTLFPPDRA